ncbi:MAG: hypothetical protein NT007_02610 [Candidatus Kapabacteria bacterium]|nr:hypothetical protein [Candidatus Kapabacteria bacterium]
MVELKRNYTMSNTSLYTLAGNLVSFMTRDNAEFTARGITTLMRNAFQTLITAFGVFPSDEEYKGLITIEVDAKAALRESIILKVQKISGYIEQKWGLSSGQYKRLAISGIQSMKENDFLFRAREVARIATEYLTDLTPLGLTDPQIDALTEEADDFEAKIHSSSDAKALRDTKARERTEKGNEIYSYVVDYTRVGKLIWENVSTAKYNDYIIYDTVTPGLSKPTNVTANWTFGDTVVHLNWDAVTGATLYEIFTCAVNFGLPSGTYSSLAEYATPPQGVAFVADKRNYYKIKAKNTTQTSDYSDEAWTEVVISS